MNAYEIIRELGPQIQGALMDSGDQGYAETIAIDNSRVTREPLVVVRPDNASDISTTLQFCQQNNVPLTTKSGGHSATGYALNNLGIVLDLVRLNHIEYVGQDEVRVGAGTRWIEVYDFLHARGDRRIIVGGGCPTVGVGGFLLGAGFSFLSRSLGLGSDNISALKIVTANGEERNIKRSSKNKHDQDLFWALQGGGGGNFGVVTEFTLKLREVHEPLMVGQIAFPFFRIEEILPFYDKFAASLPNEMALYGMMRNFPDPRNNNQDIFTLRFTPVYNGKFEDGIKLLEPLLAKQPFLAEFYAMTLPEWENFIGSATQVKGHAAYIKSVVMKKNQMHKATRVFMEHMAIRPSQDSYIVWTHTGGAIKDGPDTAYPHRDAEVVIELKSLWDESNPQQTRANVQWAYNFFTDLEPYASGAYINYIDPLLPGWTKKYYGKNYSRLVNLKNEWDPTGFFDFQQGIGSKFEPGAPFPNGDLDLSPLNWTL